MQASHIYLHSSEGNRSHIPTTVLQVVLPLLTYFYRHHEIGTFFPGHRSSKNDQFGHFFLDQKGFHWTEKFQLTKYSAQEKV